MNSFISIGSAPADKAMLKLAYALKLPTIKIDRFTPEAEKALLGLPIILCVPKSKLPKTFSILDEDKTIALLEQTISVLNKEKLSYLQNIPQNELSSIHLNFHFIPSTSDQATIEHLSNMLNLAPNIQVGSTAGKIDYNRLEDDMLESLPMRKHLSSYIKKARKHSYKKVLGVTTRASKKVGGEDNAKD